MPFDWVFILFFLALLVAILAAIGVRRVGSEDKLFMKVVLSISGALAGLFFFLSCGEVVDTKKVGIVTSFKKPESGAFGSGWNWKLPWKEVKELDAAVQNDVFKGTGSKETDSAVQVKLANESQAFVDVTVSWKIVPAAAHDLYQNYKQDGSIRKNLVVRNLESSLLSNFAGVDPLANVDEIPAATDKTGTDANQKARKDLSPVIFKDLQERLDGKHTATTADDKHLIEVTAVVVGTINYDDATQKKLNDYQAAKANLRIAEQNEKTAAAEARAIEAIAKALQKPGAVSYKCLEIWEEKGGSIPPYCFPGGTALSGIPATK